MAKITFEVDDIEFNQKMLDDLKSEENEDIFKKLSKEAFKFLDWIIYERQHGRIILSAALSAASSYNNVVRWSTSSLDDILLSLEDKPEMIYDPIARNIEKQRAREEDDKSLREGIITKEEMQQKNGFLSKLDIVNAVISKVRVKIKSS